MLRSVFQTHCVHCHGKNDNVEGEVDLLALGTDDHLQARPELLQRLIVVLRDQQMPPDGEPPLSHAERQQMIEQLHAMLQQVVSKQAFASTPMRRMNRFQYNNAVVDLLELDRDIFQLNERLLRRRDDYFRPELGKMPAEVRVSIRSLSKDIDNQRPEGFRGVSAFPQDKRAEHGFDNRADHLTLSPLLMESFMQLSQTIVDSPDLNPRECRSWDHVFAAPGQPARVPVTGRYEAESDIQVRTAPPRKGSVVAEDMRRYGMHWSGNRHLCWKCPEPGLELKLSIDVAQPGTGIRFGFTKAPNYGTFEIYLNDVKTAGVVDLHDPEVAYLEHEVTGVTIDAGTHTLRFKCVGKNAPSTNYFLGIDVIDLSGPQAGSSTSPSHLAEARIRLRSLLRRAFRRPCESVTLDRFTAFARAQLDAGGSFEQTMRMAVGAILAAPEFLYFYETPVPAAQRGDSSPAGRQRVDDFELATRLAQFFWSSIPDDRLLDLAEERKLHEPHVLGREIDRMLNDRRAARFCDNFPGQWLQLDRLITAIPDPQKFPYFYYHGYRSSMHMMAEPLLLFETIFIENRSIMDLLAPDFTWQSDMLRANYEGHSQAAHQVQIQVFRRTPLDNPRRGGVITNAAIMTMTSTPIRTQPITRGAWINSVIFNDPPQPPPADVPPLPEADAQELAKLTIRERLAAHRQRSDCAGCHSKIDPLGFALENFGPTGVWRENYENGRQVDVSGILFNQHEFKTLIEFKQLLLEHRGRFIRAFLSHLLAYALGRELGPVDSPALDDLTAQAMAGQDHLRTVLKSVAMSEPFLSKNVR